MQLFANDNVFFFVANFIGECKCSPGFVDALGNCSAISTMPQINLDVLHPSGDYMESWPVINSLCGHDDRSRDNLHERMKKMTPGSHPPTPWAPFQPQLTLYPQYWCTLAPYLTV